jgi:cold shock CspA family protein
MTAKVLASSPRRTAEKTDVFVHFSAILVQGLQSLAEGQQVELDVVQSEKGLQARAASAIQAQLAPSLLLQSSEETDAALLLPKLTSARARRSSKRKTIASPRLVAVANPSLKRILRVRQTRVRDFHGQCSELLRFGMRVRNGLGAGEADCIRGCRCEDSDSGN